MISAILFTVLVALVAAERLGEMALSARHARWAFAHGGVEHARRQMPWMVALHVGLLAGAVAEVWLLGRPFLPWLGWPALLVALGQFASQMRLLPFTRTLGSALDKVRAALSLSAQRELLDRLKELAFLGVPGLPSQEKVREALERAWFEQQPLRITYVDGDHLETTREIRLLGVVMDRRETRIDALDLAKNERRHFRLDRIARAEVLPVRHG